MTSVLIAGASGMIGGLVLQACLERDDVERVTSIVRRPSGVSHPKLKEVVHQDFADLSAISKHFRDQDICFYCVGVYTGQVDRDTFRQITVDYTQVFAEALHTVSSDVTFCFLSGMGADRTEKSRVAFAKDKGIAENILLRQGFKNLYIFRPGYIYPVTPRTEPNFSYKVMRWVYKPFAAIYPNIGVTSEALAGAMIHAAFSGHDKDTLENADLLAVAK